MKRHTKIALAVGAVALVGVAAIATTTHAHRSWHGEYGYSQGGHGYHGKGRHGGRHARALMEKFDLNADRQITRDEIDQVRNEKLQQFDADSSGSLTLPEFEGLWLDFMRERMVDRFQDLDADGDGEVTRSEIDKRLSRIVSHMDRNDDGVIDKNDRRRHHRDHDRDSRDDDND